MTFLVLRYAFWISPALVQAAIALIMLRRRLYRDYPLFFVYTLSHVLRFAILFPVYHLATTPVYRRTYLIAEVLDAALAFAAIYEVLSRMFRSYEGIRVLTAILFRWAAIILLLVAVLTCAASKGVSPHPVQTGIFVLNQGVNIVRGGLLLLAMLLCLYLRLQWDHFVFGIALGFALESSVELVAFAVRIHFGPVGSKILSTIAAAAYTCATITWIYYLLTPAPHESSTKLSPRTELDEWNQTLLALIYR